MLQTAGAQTAGDYQSTASGDWASPTTWQRFDGTSWVAATAAPTNTDGVITIQAAHTVTVNDNISADQLVVNGTLHAVNNVLTLMNGTGTDLYVTGEVIIDVNARIQDDPSGGSTVDYLGDVLVQNGGFQIATTFDGPNAQTISGAGFNSVLTVNNPKNLTVTGTQSYNSISFVSGKIVASGYLEFSQYNHNFSGQSSTSFIDGNIVLILYDNSIQSFTLPIGKGNNYTPISFTVQQELNAQTGLTVSPVNAAPPAIALPATLNSVSGTRYFTITKSDGSTTVSSRVHLTLLTMDYNSADDVVNPATLHIAKSSDTGWVDLGGTADALTSQVTAITTDTAFGNFVLAQAGAPGSWKGTADNNWNNAANWYAGTVPTAALPVFIPAGTPNSPVISDNTAAAGDVHVAGGATLTINSSSTLNVAGNLTANGTINATTGGIQFNGTAAQQSTGNITLGNLTINNSAGVTLSSGTVRVLTLYTPVAGILTTNGNLVLASYPGNTAAVAASNTPGYVSGNVTVERYIPGKRAWRMLTAPLSGAGTIQSNWQNNGVADGTAGVEIFRPGGGNGFTAGGIESSMQYYNPVTNNWVDQPNTNAATLSIPATSSAANNAYALFITGPYGATSTITTGFQSTTLKATGSLQTGDQVFSKSGVAPGNYMLIGNPFAAPVDFSKITKTNVDDNVWIWDAGQGTLGNYVTFSGDGSGGYDKVPESAAQTINVQSGQAFFVQVSAGSPASAGVTVPESAKNTGGTTNQVFFAPTAGAQQMRITLNRKNGSAFILADEVLAKFGDSYKKDITDDASKLFGYDENMSLMVDDTNYLSIERRPAPVKDDTLGITINSLKPTATYSFTIKPQNIVMPGTTAFLLDKYLNTKTPVSLTAPTDIEFTTTGDKASSAPGRFDVVFAVEGTLASTLTNVKAWQKDAGVQVEWTVATEAGLSRYETQRSADGRQFTTINAVTPRNGSGVQVYDYFDAQPLDGNNYYRIKAIDKAGVATYSSLALVNITKNGSAFNVYPNIVTQAQKVTVKLNKAVNGNYAVALYDMAGKRLMTARLNLSAYANTQQVTLPQGLAAGVYRLVMFDDKGNQWKQQLQVK